MLKPVVTTLDWANQRAIGKKGLVELAEIGVVAFNDVLHFARVFGKVGANISAVTQTSDGL